MSYQLFSDGTCDLSYDLVKERNIHILPLKAAVDEVDFLFNGDPKVSEGMTIEEFYAQMRKGKTARTAQVNQEEYRAAFEPVLAAGEDVLYIAFSSGLSGSWGASVVVAEELRAKYPERKVLVVDSLSASLGEGLLVYMVDEKRRAGASIEEAAAFAEEIKLSVHHWFTVDDLNHLKRGGRVSSAAAFFGTMLSIKPVLDVDSAGHLIPQEKVQGRKRALKVLVDRMAKYCKEPQRYPVFLSHADAAEDAQYVAGLIKERFNVNITHTHMIGPVVGGHAGPGTVALFFVGDNDRE